MNDLTILLAGLNDPSSRHREHSIKAFTSDQLQDGRVIAALQILVSTDPVEYVRDAADIRLRAAGQIPAPSLAPIKLRKTNPTKIALLVIGIFILFILICVAALVLDWRLNGLSL